MNNNFVDISGQRFGMLTVTSEHEIRRGSNGKTHTYWKCICDCGREIWARGTELRYGKPRSCNHHRKPYKHGMVNTRIYTIYNDMKQRCYNPKSKSFKNYGKRGITVCDEWLGAHGFENFSDWAYKNGYADNLTIDRIDVNGNYCPDNCRWADNYTQIKNRRNSIYVGDNEKQYLKDAAESHGFDYKTLQCRLSNGWNEENVFDSIPQSRLVTYQGKQYTLKELAEVTGIPYNTLQTRYTNNFTDEEIVRPQLESLRKPVCQYTLDGEFVAEFDSAVQASKLTGIRKSGILMCCNHQRKTCGGFKWEHKEIKNKVRPERCLRRKENGGWIDERQ